MPWSRRRLLSASIRGATSTLAAVGLAGLSPVAAAAPTRAAQKVHLTVQLSWQGRGGSFAGPIQELADAYIAKHWLSRHRGVEVTTIPGQGSNTNGSWGGTETIAAVLAGAGPDILVFCCDGIPEAMGSNVLVPLNPFMRTDNISASIFPQGVLSGLTTDQGLMGLPNAGQTMTMYYNQTLLDDLGLPYPQPSWTAAEAERLWRSIAGIRKGKPLVGAELPFAPQFEKFLLVGFGGQITDASGTKCLMNSSAALGAFEWLVPMLWDKVVTPGAGGVTAMAAGQLAFASACCGNLQQAVMEFGNGFKWDFLPLPAFPAQRTDGIYHALYGMNAASRAPHSLLWDLLKFLTVEPGWQRYFNAQLAFAAPNQVSPGLWDDYLSIVRSVAPILKTKHLEYVAEASQYGQGWSFFKYAPEQAVTIMTKYYDQILSKSLGIETALREMTAQVDALETESAASTAQVNTVGVRARALLAEAAGSRSPVSFPNPPTTGAGLPPAPAGSLVVQPSGGQWRVTGAGAGLLHTTDDGTFAATIFPLSQGTLTVRLTAVSMPKPGGTLNPGAKVGLMARGDLSDNAPMVAVVVTGGHGVHVTSRPIAGLGQYDQNQNNTPGLLNAGALLPRTSGSGNLLKTPLWLRLHRADGVWTAFTSLDGVKWLDAGTPVQPVMAGCWLGLFVSSHVDTMQVAAVFDHAAGFVPDRYVLLGGSGG